MDLFRWFRSRPEPDREWWMTVARLEQRQKQLELEWEDTFDKVRHALAKMGKREKAASSSIQDALGSTNGEGGRVGLGRAPVSEYAKRLAAARARYGRGE